MSPGGSRPDSDARTALLLLLFFTLLYALESGGHVYSPDALTMARTSESLLDRGQLAISDPGYPPGFLTEGRQGRQYAKYGLGMPIVGVPFVALGRSVGELLGPDLAGPLFAGPRFLWYDPGDSGPAWSYFGASLTAAPLVAGAVSLVFLLARGAGWERDEGLVIAAVAGLASPLPVYAKTFFSEPLAVLGITAAAWALARGGSGRPGASRADGDRSDDVRWAGIAGSAIGVAVLAKIAHLVLVPLVAGILVWRASNAADSGRAIRRRTLAFLAGLAPVGILLAAANLGRFGAVLATGYGNEATRFTTPLAEGLSGLLASPGRGLAVYFPLALVSALAWRGFLRRSPEPALLAAGGTATFLALYAPWHGWDGGWTWGPRFFVPLVPLLVLAAAPWLLGSGWRRAAAWTSALASLAINWIGTLVPFTEYHALLRDAVGGGYLPVARWSWRAWPPLAYLEMPWDYWLLPRIVQTPGAWPLAAAFGAMAGVLPFLAWKIVRPGPSRARALVGGVAVVGSAVAVAFVTARGLV